MKRELITREDALMALTGNFDLGVTMNQYTLNCQKHIKAINAIPEKEIVKPYLDKLKHQIHEKTFESGMMNPIMTYTEIMYMIDKLLS